jgi:lysophospholipase L1-like esterase
VYGASHTAADFLTDRLRDRLQKRFGDAGHGFVMPVRPWSRYRHIDTRTHNSSGWICDRAHRVDDEVGLYGLAGFACETTAKAQWARVEPSRWSPEGTRADRVEVFFLRQRGGGRFELLVDGRVQARISTRSRRRHVGMRRVRVPDEPHTVEIRTLGGGPVRLLGMVLERDRPGVVVDTLGINGQRAAIQLRWQERAWRRQVRWRSPSLIVLAYGTNELAGRVPIREVRARLKRVVQRIRRAAPSASCLLIGPSDRPQRVGGTWVVRERQPAVIEAQRAVAHESGCGYWDLAAAMGGEGSMVRWVEAGLARRDHVHLTRDGYRVLADRLLAALLDELP